MERCRDGMLIGIPLGTAMGIVAGSDGKEIDQDLSHLNKSEKEELLLELLKDKVPFYK
jgi:hypothetical protein